MIRSAAPGDAGLLATIHVESSQAAYAQVFPASWLAKFSLERRAAQYNAMLDNAEIHEWLLVSEGDHGVDGFIHAGPNRDEAEQNAELDVGEIYTLYVAPNAWGRGVGSGLLDAAVERFRSEGFAVASLWVLEMNERARRFYEARGWLVGDGEQSHDADGHLVTEVRYSLSLG